MKGCFAVWRNITWSLLAMICLFLWSSSITYAQDPRADEAYKKGETLFKAQCTSCHKVSAKLVGPALAGVYDKYDREWLYKWVKNSQDMVKAGDAKAVAIFEEYNKSVMTAFNLSNAEIDDILAYIKVETENPVVATPAAGGGAAAGAPSESNLTTLFLAGIAFLLLVIMFVLSRLGGTLNNLVRERMGKFSPLSIPFEKYLFSKKTLAMLGVAGIVWLGFNMVEGATSLGRQKGYAPAQPIKFSHKLHAGTNKIDCQYCHIGVTKGKSAVIPAANTCMNCHKAIKSGPQHGTTEIAKIYKAVGWDADKGKYIEGYEEQPIEWVRIHNLPDHVYFNHSQHFVAGGVACKTCHGAIEEMDVVEQQATLGMGWCVNCHRETPVKFNDNSFYQTYEVLHEKLKKGEIKQVTVEEIGGIECQKCHY